jgi:hypothetical protein
MRGMRRILLGVFGAALVVASACDSGDDTVQPLAKKDAGSSSSSGDAASTDGATVNTDTICYRLGGYTKVQAISAAVLKAVSADCRIGAYFTGLAVTDQTHFTDCFGRQLGELLGCDGITYAGSSDSLQVACRTLAEAHQAVDPQITDADFDAFVADAVAEMRRQGASTSDLGTIGPILNGTRHDVSQTNDTTLGQSTCDAGPTDAGSDAQDDAADVATDTGVADADDAG